MVNGRISWTVNATPDICYPGSTLRFDNWTYSDLFYETELDLGRRTFTSIETSNESAIFNMTNNGDHDLTYPIFYHGNGSDDGNGTWTGFNMSIAGRSTVSLNSSDEGANHFNSNSEVENYIDDILISNNLTQRERKDLLSYWTPLWFNSTQSFVLAFMTIAEYDDLLPLTVEPTPKTVRRVGIYWIDDIPVTEI